MRRSLENAVVDGATAARRVRSMYRDRLADAGVREVLTAVLETVGPRYGKPEEWAIESTRHTETDASVVVVSARHHGGLVVKFADRLPATLHLIREAANLGDLGLTSGFSNGRRSLIPRVLSTGEVGSVRYIVTQRLPGEDAREVAVHPELRETAIRSAADAITKMHWETSSPSWIDAEHVARWSDAGLTSLGTVFNGDHSSSSHALGAVQRYLHDTLCGRRLTVGWLHGDYWLGNVLITPDARQITGIVDWDAAREGVQLIDLLHLLVTSRMIVRRAQFGDIVSSLVDGDPWLAWEQEILERAIGDARSDRELLVATLVLDWLQHVLLNLEQSARYAQRRIWMRRNVIQVLDRLQSDRTHDRLSIPAGARARYKLRAEPSDGDLPLDAGRPSRRLRAEATLVGAKVKAQAETATRASAQVLRRAVQAAPLRVGRDAVRSAFRDYAAWALPVVLAAFAGVLWLGSLGDIDVREMNDFGLISVLPGAVFASLALLTGSFILALRHPARQLVLLLDVLLLIVIVHGTPALVEEVPRFAVTWRHVGVADYIAHHHAVDPNIDAYFNWPGFFAFLAFTDGLAGLKSPLGFAAWAPLIFNALYLGPLLIVYRTAFVERQLVWLAVWLFYLTNWVGQDYLSPQGMTYFLYLAFVAALIRWFVKAAPSDSLNRIACLAWEACVALSRRCLLAMGWPLADSRASASRDPAQPQTRLLVDDTATPRQRMALALVSMFLFAAIVPTHQLTPFAALAAAFVLVVAGFCSIRGLPLLAATLIGTWMLFMAWGFLGGHFATLTHDVGNVEGSVGASVGARVSGSFGHVTVVAVRLAVAAVLWLLAGLGIVRALRDRRPLLPFAALAIAPFPLVGLQEYGGEILLRIYLFSLPFMVLFVALLLAGRPSSTGALFASWRRCALLGAVCSALLLALLVARYGNERMDVFTKQEVAAADAVYRSAVPDSVVVAATPNMPWKFRNYDELTLVGLTSTKEWQQLDESPRSIAALVARIEKLTSGRPSGTRAYVLLSASQQAEIDLLREGPADAIARLRTALTSSRAFRTVLTNRDAAVFAARSGGHRA